LLACAFGFSFAGIGIPGIGIPGIEPVDWA
jgi:hypothetical protein